MRRTSSKFIGQFRILTDTEAETSIDLEKSLELQPLNAQKRKSSLFNFSPDKSTTCTTEEFKSLGIRARQELKDWNSLFIKLKDELKQSKHEYPIVDWSILPDEKRLFLEQSPNLDRILRRVQEFECAAHEFMDNCFEDAINLQNTVENLCSIKACLVKESKVEKLIASGDF